MESVQEQIYRRLFPQLIPRLAIIALAATMLTWANARVRSSVLAHIPGPDLQQLYVIATSTLSGTAILFSYFGLVVGYFYRLRTRKLHTSLSEAGLAFRAVVASVLAAAAAIFVIGLNFGW
jgi:hypothetical protein